ncbi:hypothetical protein [Spirosoma flavum]|uniref:Uncharacterized protein n=1 Tax=Spirosoma flavum TaxID=2048557 RepID=A0ABW6AHX3_9BACT
MMSFPGDNEKIGIFSMPGMIAVIPLNGLLSGTALTGLASVGIFLKIYPTHK